LIYIYDCTVTPREIFGGFTEVEIFKKIHKAPNHELTNLFYFYCNKPNDPIFLRYDKDYNMMVHPGTKRFLGAALRNTQYNVDGIIVSEIEYNLRTKGITDISLRETLKQKRISDLELIKKYSVSNGQTSWPEENLLWNEMHLPYKYKLILPYNTIGYLNKPSLKEVKEYSYKDYDSIIDAIKAMFDDASKNLKPKTKPKPKTTLGLTDEEFKKRFGVYPF
jgi:hypothetical protein